MFQYKVFKLIFELKSLVQKICLALLTNTRVTFYTYRVTFKLNSILLRIFVREFIVKVLNYTVMFSFYEMKEDRIS